MKMNRENYFNFSNTPMVIERCVPWYVVHSPPSSYIANIIAVSILNIIFAIAGAVLNSLVVFSFWKSAKLRSKVCHFAPMILCSTDLAVVTVGQPLYISVFLSEVSGSASCLYRFWVHFVDEFIYKMSVWSLFVTNVERYLAIVHPLWHRVNVTKGRLLFSCVCFWLYTAVWQVSSVFSSFARNYFTPFHGGLVCCTTIFVYSSIFLASRKSFSKVKTPDLSANQEDVDRHMTVWRELKIAKSYFLIVSLTFICYIPYIVFLARQSLWYRNDETHINLVEVYSYPWAVTIGHMISILNCIVFFWTNRGLRKESSKIIGKYFSRTKD